MHWLLTVKSTADLKRLRLSLERLGAVVCSEEEFVPLDDDELVIKLEAPAELEDHLPRDPEIVMLSPDSEMELYRVG